MAEIVLFHSVMGLRPVERQIATWLAAAGHDVTLPDLYEGRVGKGIDAGFALYNDIGADRVLARARAALARAPDRAVLAGISMGTLMVTRLWDTRPKAAGALMLCGLAPVATQPRPGLPVQAHVARPDPHDSDADIDGWAAGMGAKLHLYPDVGHFFLDEALSDHDARAARLCLDRVTGFLADLDG